MTQTRARASFAIPWHLTETDGVRAAPLAELRLGAVWRWHGEAVRLDAGDPALRPYPPEHHDRRARAARIVAQLSGIDARAEDIDLDPYDDDLLSDGTVALTDGRQEYVLSLVTMHRSGGVLAMTDGALPPQDTELRVIRPMRSRAGRGAALRGPADLTGFAAGTRVATPDGPVAVEHLHEGDRVLTEDAGAQPVQWIGARRISGSQLYLRPDFRPVRIAPGAFAAARPHASLLVAPGQGVLLHSSAAGMLFNATEVLVAGRDLGESASIERDLQVTEATYFNLMLGRHAILFANGTACESFHPAAAALSTLSGEDRARLAERWPALARNPQSYGPFARRRLDAGEAAILAASAA
ncbi:Hint domain-containing protein [Citreimonas salinaria]|uniref:Hint domain-containing protein n=1 Tax=Citreimonas salinaria TaxID=321339 RepID=A0A1H3LRB7_9RHOB|nr:Hint domain-containing protein [Citreimonas salinaria]SDY66982.1 Hint domain-containing protein [Citreimonas salinaria]